MSTITSPETRRQAAERLAWGHYADTLRDRDGRDYEDAERVEWLRLQRTLRTVARTVVA